MAEVAYRIHSRGIGLDWCHTGCFICGLKGRTPEDAKFGAPLLNNVTAPCSVVDQAAIVELFDRGARMAYRHGDGRAPQVKIFACDRHLPALEHLSAQHYLGKSGVDHLVITWRRLDGAAIRDAFEYIWARFLTGPEIPWSEYWERRRAKESADVR